MKKYTRLALVLCLAVCLLCGCGQTREPAPTETEYVLPEVPQSQEILTPNLSGWKEYKLESGLCFSGPQGLGDAEVEGMAAYLRNAYFLVLAIEEPKTGTVLENITKQEYAAMLAENNGLDPFVTDCYGNLATTNTALSYEGKTMFFYYVTVLETENSFFLIQIATPEELAQDNVLDMAAWSASFTWAPPQT